MNGMNRGGTIEKVFLQNSASKQPPKKSNTNLNPIAIGKRHQDCTSHRPS